MSDELKLHRPGHLYVSVIKPANGNRPKGQDVKVKLVDVNGVEQTLTQKMDIMSLKMEVSGRADYVTCSLVVTNASIPPDTLVEKIVRESEEHLLDEYSRLHERYRLQCEHLAACVDTLEAMGGANALLERIHRESRKL